MFCATSAKQYPFRPTANGHFPFSAPPAALALLQAAPFLPQQRRNLYQTYVAIGTYAKANGCYGHVRRDEIRQALDLTAPTYRKHERMLVELGVLRRGARTLTLVHYAQGNSGPQARAAWLKRHRGQNAARSRRYYANHTAQKRNPVAIFVPQVPVIADTQRFITGACAPSPKPKAVLPFKKEISISQHERRKAAEAVRPTEEEICAIEEELTKPSALPKALPTAGDPLARLSAMAEELDEQSDWHAEQEPTSASLTEEAWAAELAATPRKPAPISQAMWARFKARYPEFAGAQLAPFRAAGYSPETLLAAADGVRRRKGPKANPPGLLLHGCRMRAQASWVTPARFGQLLL